MTLAELKAAIDSRHQMGLGSAHADIADALEDARFEYRGEPFWGLDLSDSFNTVAATESYDLPQHAGSESEVIELLFAEITYSGRAHELTRVTFEEMRRLKTGAASDSYPTRYALYNDQIVLYPTPADAWQVDLYYRGDLLLPTSAGGSNWWTVHGYRLLLYKALAILLLDHDEDDARGLKFEQKAEQQRRLLIAESNRRRAGKFPRIRSHPL